MTKTSTQTAYALNLFSKYRKIRYHDAELSYSVESKDQKYRPRRAFHTMDIRDR